MRIPQVADGWRAARHRWTGYRARQRAALEASQRIPPHADELGHDHRHDHDPFPDGWVADRPGREADAVTGATRAEDPAAGTEQGPTSAPERPGPRRQSVPMTHQSPFRVGFVGAIGVLAALTLWNAVGALSLTITLLTVALFLTLALDPIVQRLIRGGLSRGPAVLVVFLGLLVVFALLAWLVLPPVIDQSTALVHDAPGYVDRLLSQRWVHDLDKDYDLSGQVRRQVNQRLTDQSFLSTVAGGIIGASQMVGNVVFQTFTVLILTLYFLASLPTTKKAAYAMVPASRRARVVYLSEEMMRRVGSYAIGQVAVAAINGTLSWVAMRVLGVPYAEVLAVSVAFLGVIPMVGATLGGTLVTLAGLLQSTQTGIVLLVYYVVYQQVENYVIVPRIMRRTVAVPGAVTVVAALAGGTLLGMLGALLAIPAAAALLLLYEEVLVPRQRQL